MSGYTKEEQIAQAEAYMKMVKESGKTCGLMDDLQHMGSDGKDWTEEFSKVLEEEIEGEIILVKPQEIKKPKDKKKPSMMPSTPEGWARFIKQTENL